MPYKEKEIEKVYFSIGEVASMFEVATSHIRFWEKEFDIINPKKNSRGDRMFTKEDIENFKLIFHLVKEKGLTLQGAKDVLKNKKHHAMEKYELIKSLTKVREFLTDLKDNL